MRTGPSSVMTVLPLPPLRWFSWPSGLLTLSIPPRQCALHYGVLQLAADRLHIRLGHRTLWSLYCRYVLDGGAFTFTSWTAAISGYHFRCGSRLVAGLRRLGIQ